MPRFKEYHERKRLGICQDCSNACRPFVRCEKCRQRRYAQRVVKPSLKGRKRAR